MKVYLSLPITGYDEMERRTYAARMCGLLTYEHEGWEVINPFLVADRLRKERLEKGDFSLPSYDELMRADIEVLKGCEMALFCPGWHISDGCREEMWESWWNGVKVGFVNKDGEARFG
ncbi:MAG: DUF4406 domain-containing protein [Prevotellaceae bacterium]|nr:DUF4406 domain-containing protein [Prevotellaceae bacterium]